ncbi:MAG: TVP38/TMEM64 family protein [Alphaproteobacteria bacterium]|nr:TVP38/TMEM64 family protein [Alphaproteobacteria bacterium]
MPIVKRFAPLVVLIVLVAVIFATGLHRYLSFETLRQNRETLTAFVADNQVGAALLFVLVYAAAVACSLPGATVLTVTGGFLFGAVFGTIYVVLAATLGATLVFLIARSSLGHLLRARAGGALQRLEAGFRAGAFNYLLFLRLVPAFPFFLVNLVPAFLGVPLRTYVLATLIGIIPASFVFTVVGVGLGSIFDRQEYFTLAGALTPEIIAALVGLGVLALVPIAVKKWRDRRR